MRCKQFTYDVTLWTIVEVFCVIKSNCEWEAKKTFQALKGFKPVTSAIPVQTSCELSSEATTIIYKRAVHFLAEHSMPLLKRTRIICRLSFYCSVNSGIMNDHCAYLRILGNCEWLYPSQKIFQSSIGFKHVTSKLPCWKCSRLWTEHRNHN